MSNLHIKSYNENAYINVIKHLHTGITKVEAFLNQIEREDDFQNIDGLINLYDSIFSEPILKLHLGFKVERVYKSLYLRTPGPYNKGNSYFHITLKFISDAIMWLDEIYDQLLSRLIKFYKHLFSRIDNFYLSHSTIQIQKYSEILLRIKREVSKFLESVEHRYIIDQREKLNLEYLNRIPFGGLFHVSHVNNVSSILNRGILSHKNAHQQGLVKVDISNLRVNNLRDRVEESLGGNIHDYVPLYFHPRNPTFYSWCKNEDRDNLFLFKINPHILLIDNVAFSDGNAAVNSTKFYKNIDDFNKLNWQIIKADYWTNYPDGKRIKCSEALVKDVIPIEYILNIFVFSEVALEKLLPLFPNHLGIVSTIDKDLYF